MLLDGSERRRVNLGEEENGSMHLGASERS